MPELNQQQPIHPSDCACRRCTPAAVGNRSSVQLQITLLWVLTAALSTALAAHVLGLT